MPTVLATPSDLLVTQGEARRGSVSYPAVAVNTAAGIGSSVMRAEADDESYAPTFHWEGGIEERSHEALRR